ncbi:ABC transporter ATP-binding protein [Sporolactobacillus spathodeae]
MMSMSTILEINQLSLATTNKKQLVTDVSLAVGKGKTIGIVGESGSGKSLTLRAIIQLLPPTIIKVGGTIRCESSCAMIFQDPVSALDPLCPVVRQVAEVVSYRQHLSRKTSRTKALELLALLGLPEDLKRNDRYPHQLSGGQRQRVLIAIALACRPGILLCDEPTTALDVTVQKQILELLAKLQRELNFALVFVTHNLAIASALCTKLYVMKEGRIVEQGRTQDILANPQHAYTKMLIDSVLHLPDLKGVIAGE